jgi:imidazolonepropionase-like amidohydrolase
MARTLFSGGSVFDGTGAPPAAADVVVEDGRIVEVGPGLDGDDVVACTGRTVMPGLVDCHVHVVVSSPDFTALLHEPFSMRFFTAERNLRATLDAGITNVRDASGADLGIKTAQQRGWIVGPRLQISISMISQTGGHGDSHLACGLDVPVFGGAYPGKPAGIADGPDAMRRTARELLREGADVLKVATSGGVLSPRDDPRHGHFRDDELAVLVAEASAAGRFVMAHAQATDGIKAAVRAGIRSIEHGIYLDDEAISMMLERGTYLVPTLVAPRGVLDAAERGAPIPEEMLAKSRMVMEAHEDSISRAIAAGVKVAMGTDSGVAPHGQNLRELPLMVKCGMSPSEALVATTRTAAECMGIADEFGTIAAGKRADLVLVEGDPLDVDTLAERVRAVYQDGVLVSAGAD